VKKWIALVATLVVVSLFGWLIWRRAAEEKVAGDRGPRGPAAVPVEVTEVRRATIRDISSLTGSLISRSYYVVAPKIGGRLEQLLVNLGDVVKQGQLLAVLDDEEYDQQVEQARAELEVAKASVQEAKSGLDSETREYERVQTLRTKSVASESELDAARARYEVQESRYKVALAQVDQKDASLKAAQVRLSYTRIQAAWEDGGGERVVGERFVDEGAMLRANDPIVSIVDLGSLTAVVHVVEEDYSKIKVARRPR
jgi:RND family efflux transporter MFP subunit